MPTLRIFFHPPLKANVALVLTCADSAVGFKIDHLAPLKDNLIANIWIYCSEIIVLTAPTVKKGETTAFLVSFHHASSHTPLTFQAAAKSLQSDSLRETFRRIGCH